MTGCLRHFLRETSGSVTLFVVLLFPILMLIGGLATDATRLNAQKRYVQSQADLAAMSAARYLPDYARARLVARNVVSRNDAWGEVVLPDPAIEFGTFSRADGFVAHPNQANPVGSGAVKVTVDSPYQAILLSPVLPDNQVTISRAGVGASSAIVVFTLRNRLLGVNTREAILGPALSSLGLGLNVAVLSYEGLANARVRLDQLLSLISLGLAAETFTFNDVLNLPVTMPVLLGGLAGAGGLPGGALPAPGSGSAPVTLQEVMSVSPSLLHARLGDVLPDVTVNAFDLLMAFLGLAADPAQRLNVSTGLDLAPLANVGLQLGLIRPPVIGIGRIGDDPPPRAEVSQVETTVEANVLGQGNTALLRLRLNLALGTAYATATSLNCGASAPSDQLALFDVRTAPIEIALRIGLLDPRAAVAAKDMNRVNVASVRQDIAIRFDQFRKPVPVRNPLTLSGLVADVGSFLDSIRADLQARINAGACEAGLLSLLLCPLVLIVNTTLAALLTVLSGIVNSLAWVIGSLGVDAILQTVLDLLGIGVAQADLILDDYSCATKLVH